jgi:hypothetical protein
MLSLPAGHCWKVAEPFPSEYKAIISNLLQFKESNETPMYTDITELDNGHGIEECLQTKEAKCHKSFHLKINNTKLERIRHHRSDTEQDSHQNKRARNPNVVLIVTFLIARSKQVTGSHQVVKADGKLHYKWHECIRVDDNKRRLFSFLADEILQNTETPG